MNGFRQLGMRVSDLELGFLEKHLSLINAQT
jgi:hypothetical protein